MSSSLQTAAGIRLASSVSPALGARLALPLFFSTRPRMPVRAADLTTHQAARRGVIRVRGRAVHTYEWGTGARTALLVHGWQGRASQFATLVRDLVAEGYRVHAFDAPAHGGSPGSRTDARDWIAAAQRLADDDGPFELVVGHSFGAFAALAAVRHGVEAARVVSIAGAGTPHAFLAQFSRMLGLPAPARAALESAFHRRLGLTRSEAGSLLDSLSHPLPDTTELLVIHDVNDRALDTGNALALHAAHEGRSRLLLTEGLGHTRPLTSDDVLDTVLAFAGGGTVALDDAGIAGTESARTITS